jgi:hypothetical protein
MKSTARRTIFLTALLMALVFICAQASAAQHGYRVTKNIAFKKGQISTTVNGTIPNTLEGHEYIFRARQGQTLLVSLISTKRDISFSIETPNGEFIDEETALKKWSGELPETGNYRLIINTASKGAAQNNRGRKT